MSVVYHKDSDLQGSWDFVIHKGTCDSRSLQLDQRSVRVALGPSTTPDREGAFGGSKNNCSQGLRGTPPFLRRTERHLEGLGTFKQEVLLRSLSFSGESNSESKLHRVSGV